MKKFAITSIIFIFITSCGPSQNDKNIAAVTCSIMSETRIMDAAIRVREMNDAREKIGGEPFLRGDDAIQEAFEYRLCQELVLNKNYDETLQSLKDAKQEREWIAREKQAEESRIAAEKRAEENRIAAKKLAEENRIAAEKQRIADSKPTVKEEFYSSGKLRLRRNHKPKSDGGKLHGLWEVFGENGQLEYKGNFKDGEYEGIHEYYYKNGQLESKVNWKDGKRDGLYETYLENGELEFKICYKNGDNINMSYCEK